MTSIASIKDDSLILQGLSTGFTVGRKVGVSLLDNEVISSLRPTVPGQARAVRRGARAAGAAGRARV